MDSDPAAVRSNPGNRLDRMGTRGDGRSGASGRSKSVFAEARRSQRLDYVYWDGVAGVEWIAGEGGGTRRGADSRGGAVRSGARTKLQTSERHQAPNTKHQAPAAAALARFGAPR